MKTITAPPRITKLFNVARPNKNTDLSGKFSDLKRNRSFCCFAHIEHGYCSMCGVECDNLF